MSRKSKILTFLLLIFFILVLYLILTSETPAKLNVLNWQAKDEKAAQLEENYKVKAEEIFSFYVNLAKDNDFTPEKLNQLKNQALALKVPAKFKEFHINFILALTKMENYLSGKDESEKNASLDMANQLKAGYSWLNN